MKVCDGSVRHFNLGILLCASVLLGAACRPKPVTPTNLRKVVFQTDWFPQAEHGGFYQALAKGYYRDAG